MTRRRAASGKDRTRRWRLAFAAMLFSATGALPAFAKVQQVNERGFVVQLTASVPAPPGKVWDELVNPADWWDSDHSFSGDAENFTLEAKPGGCFCETLPGADAGAPPRGGVEHMRVVYVEKPRAIRLRGALGPLQADAVVGTLTIQLKPGEDGGTQILWEYVVGGFMRAPVEAVSASVDKVLGEQIGRLAAKLGAKPNSTDAQPKESEKPADDKVQGKTEIIGR
jgi:uncharacterized protein YndB with AHSA1/START domain